VAAGDVEQLSTLWANDLVLQTPGHRAVDRAKILAMYGKGGHAKNI